MTGLHTTVTAFDRIFNEASAEQYYMSIRLLPDGLFYAIYDPAQNKYLAFESALIAGSSEMYRFVENHNLLKLRFGKKICMVPSPKYTLVPASLYLNGKEDEYFNFAHTRSNIEQLDTISLIGDQVKMIYAVDEMWVQICKEMFPDAKRLPASGAFLELINARFRTMQSTGIFINLYAENFDLLIMENGKLKYCNCFNYKASDDITYYTLFVIDQLNINPETTDVRVAGLVESKSPVIRLLRKYIRNVNLLNMDEVRVSYALNDIPLHAFTDIFNSGLCEL